MLFINRPSFNPYFNIAAEEYVFKNIDEDVFMIWRNEPSIIIGKHQVPLQEVNIRYAAENNIPIIRRISGGGTVYHDLGNVNFSFITTGETSKLVDFKKYLDPIILSLVDLGIKTEITGKNNLAIGGKKISGNAAHVFKNKVIHHGTLLFSSEMTTLKKSLQISEGKIESKAVKSIPSPTTNIKDHLPPIFRHLDVFAFQQSIVKSIRTYYPKMKTYSFSSQDINTIQKLVDDKYKNWEWNEGYSPNYHFEKTSHVDGEVVSVELFVEKGVIKAINILCPKKYFNTSLVINNLMHTPHTYLHVKENLEKINLQTLQSLFF